MKKNRSAIFLYEYLFFKEACSVVQMTFEKYRLISVLTNNNNIFTLYVAIYQSSIKEQCIHFVRTRKVYPTLVLSCRSGGNLKCNLTVGMMCK